MTITIIMMMKTEHNNINDNKMIMVFIVKTIVTRDK